MAEQSELDTVLLRILHKGILRIRVQGFAGLANQCALEADHIHNLPLLILKPTLQEISYYFDVTRIGFIKSADDTREFEADWNRLASILSEMPRVSN
jgi:hypothetical protein